jgi:hypothetical protein
MENVAAMLRSVSIMFYLIRIAPRDLFCKVEWKRDVPVEFNFEAGDCELEGVQIFEGVEC